MNSKKNNTSYTIDDIKQMATNSSFERGEDYFLAGSVRNIVKKGNRFDGVVYGSQKYKVHLMDEGNTFYLDCNCPYDFGGICKHLVAFAFEILEGNYQETTQETAVLSDNEFEDIYSKIAQKKKLLFLSQLLNRDNNLRQQFISFSKDPTEKLDNIIGEKLEDIKSEIHAKLSNIDFNDLRHNNGGYHGYGDYYDDMYDAACDEIKALFAPYMESIHGYINKGNLLDAVRIALGLYEGAQNLPELDNEEYVFDGEYNVNVQIIIHEHIGDVSASINNLVKSDKAILQIITLVFERISLYKHQKESEKNEIIYNVKKLELLFNSFVISNKTAVFLHKKLQENNLESLESAFVLLNIATASDNEKLWLETAETYASLHDKIAKQLLEKYRSKKLIADFNRVAKMAFQNWANKFDKYLIDCLDKTQQEYLYIQALKNYVSHKRSTKYYHVLKTYFSEQEKIGFIDKFKNDFSSIFYVQLLEIEKRYAEILACVYKNSYEIETLIQPILNIYPYECFSIIVKLNNAALNTDNRGRRTYQTMVETLKLLKNITSMKDETSSFLRKLYNRKPILPALKDEMRKANLMTETHNL